MAVSGIEVATLASEQNKSAWISMAREAQEIAAQEARAALDRLISLIADKDAMEYFGHKDDLDHREFSPGEWPDSRQDEGEDELIAQDSWLIRAVAAVARIRVRR